MQLILLLPSRARKLQSTAPLHRLPFNLRSDIFSASETCYYSSARGFNHVESCLHQRLLVISPSDCGRSVGLWIRRLGSELSGKALLGRVVFLIYRLACMKCPRIARLSSLIMPSRLVAGLPCPVYGRSLDYFLVFQPLCHVSCKPPILSVSLTQLNLLYRFSSAQSLHSL